MDYYQGVVFEYLRADRSLFINTEFCLQMQDGNPDKTTHWYCDAVVLNFTNQVIWLCEISYARDLGALRKRLAAWIDHWELLVERIKVLTRTSDACAPWQVRVWLFVRPDLSAFLLNHMQTLQQGVLRARITSLDDVQPWRYPSWDRPALVDSSGS